MVNVLNIRLKLDAMSYVVKLVVVMGDKQPLQRWGQITYSLIVCLCSLR
jgi:hypothetical protein